MSNTAPNLYQRINAVRKAIGYIQKDKAVSAGAGGSYKAVTHDAVSAMLRSHMIEHGIIIIPALVAAEFHGREVLPGKNGELEPVKQRLYAAKYRFRVLNADAPDDSFDTDIEAHALDNGDKAPGKALSYATKMLMLKLFNLETGDDDESRYQREEFDISPHVDALRACQTLEALQQSFASSFPVVQHSGDKEAIKTLIAVKDREKIRLAKPTLAEQA